jgi:hypothetical protein
MLLTAAPRRAEGEVRASRAAEPALRRLQRVHGNQAVRRMLAADADQPAPAATAAAIEVARGGGEALDPGARRSMEHGFGADFGSVRVHTGPQAAALSRALDARAFTTGSDVFFGESQYRPGTPSGRELIAHELAHVVQQGGAAPAGPLMVGSATDPAEREADAVARQIVAAEHEAGS